MSLSTETVCVSVCVHMCIRGGGSSQRASGPVGGPVLAETLVASAQTQAGLDEEVSVSSLAPLPPTSPRIAQDLCARPQNMSWPEGGRVGPGLHPCELKGRSAHSRPNPSLVLPACPERPPPPPDLPREQQFLI